MSKKTEQLMSHAWAEYIHTYIGYDDTYFEDDGPRLFHRTVNQYRRQEDISIEAYLGKDLYLELTTMQIKPDKAAKILGKMYWNEIREVIEKETGKDTKDKARPDGRWTVEESFSEDTCLDIARASIARYLWCLWYGEHSKNEEREAENSEKRRNRKPKKEKI
jgi:hypothetical protein